jgi:hypothetical protein
MPMVYAQSKRIHVQSKMSWWAAPRVVQRSETLFGGAGARHNGRGASGLWWPSQLEPL